MAHLHLGKFFGVSGLIVLISGGGTGIGLMMAQGLAANGAKVYIGGRRKDVIGKAAREHGEELSGKILPIALDVTSKGSIESAVELISLENDGKLDVLINNAGQVGPASDFFSKSGAPERKETETLRKALFKKESFQDWADLFAVNVSSWFFLSTACLVLLEKASKAREVATGGRSSSIIGIASVSKCIWTDEAFAGSLNPFPHLQLPPTQIANLALGAPKLQRVHPPIFPRHRITYQRGPTLEDEKRALDAQENSTATNKNALCRTAPVVAGMSVGNAQMYNAHPIPESQHQFAKYTIPRPIMLQAWRKRMGLDLSTRVSAASASKGGLLSTSILDRIVVFMLLDAPPGTRPRATLENFTLACRRFRHVAAPYVYQHAVVRGNGDAGVYARTGNSKLVRSLTIQFEPYDPWNPYSALLDQMLYPKPLHTPDQIQETGIEYFFPNLTQITFSAKYTPDDSCTMWRASAQILGPEFGTDDFPPQNFSKIYENPAFLAVKLVGLVPTKVKTVTLDADVVGLASKFAVAFMTRAGNRLDKARLDIVTRRDEVIQETEVAIHGYSSTVNSEAQDCTTIVMYGPSYGTRIVWDGTMRGLASQTVWPRDKQPDKPVVPEEVLPPTWETLGPGPRHSTRNSTSPYKNPSSPEEGGSARKKGELTLMVKPRGKMPMYAADRARAREPFPEPEIAIVITAPEVPKPIAEPKMIPLGQRWAWNAGQMLAEYSDVLASTFKQVNDSFAQFAGNTKRLQLQGEDAKYPEFWTFVDNLTGKRTRVGVWHTTARIEVDMFVTAFRGQRFGFNMRSLKFQIMRELGKGRSGVVVGKEAGKARIEGVEQSMTNRKVPKGSCIEKTGESSSSPEGRATKRVRIA
ncbi:DNA-directed RNA polymerase subunit beta' [Rhizoctonia solani]|uniref:DNA-directed RNA polymerase subunit beta n=1 Tax=Rhizoctonia solani TaxID=456999 RepID=A0A0K6GAU8_9AGAM|nr:DNA-directed RNA polymerase subunit beta' [Rhizoctonia solani]